MAPTKPARAVKHNIAAIRRLLINAFTPEELWRFCQERPTFRPVLPYFPYNASQAQMVDVLTEFCQRHMLFDTLVSEIKGVNPAQYEHYRDQLDGDGEPGEDRWTPPPVYHNLPQPDYVRFVGREEELARVHELLSPANRAWVVTIDGIGGIGKSALALEVAHHYLRDYAQLPPEERFEAIIWTSAKVAVLTADGIAPRQQITGTLGDIYTTISVTLEREDITRARPEEQDEVVTKTLTRQRTLLIVDNLETIDDERVSAFLRELPAPTKAIVTTRHRLDVAYPVRLMGMPEEDGLKLIAQECAKKSVALMEGEAERLFIRTGGIPLALVWSVAQIGYGYDVDAVLHRLGQPTGDIARFCFQGALEHIQGTDAHRLLVSLSHFATDASRDSLKYVTALSQVDLDEGLVTLERLSLVNKQGDRFRLLPLTKIYAQEELSRDPAWHKTVKGRWSEYFGKLLVELHSNAYKGRALFAVEQSNLLQWLDWLWTERLYVEYIDFSKRLEFFLWFSGQWGTWRDVVERALGVSIELQDESAEARFYYILSMTNQLQGNLEQARVYGNRAEFLYKVLGDESRYALAATRVGWIVALEGDLDTAEEKHREAIEILARAGHDRHLSRAWRGLAYVEIQRGRLQVAKEYLHSARALREKETSKSGGLSFTYRLLGRVAAAEGDLDEARQHIERSLAIGQELGIASEIAESKFELALVDRMSGHPEAALRRSEEALETFRRLGRKEQTASAEAFIDELACEYGEAARG